MRMQKMVLIKLSPADSTTETLIYTLLGLNTEDLTDAQLDFYCISQVVNLLRFNKFSIANIQF